MDMDYGAIITKLLGKTKYSFNKSIRNYFFGCGFTIPQLKVLSILSQNSEMRISDISTEIGFSNSTTSGIIDRLENMGLVERIRQKNDRRVVKVVLTQKSNKYEHDFELMINNYFADLFRNASEEDLKAVAYGFEVFNRILDIQK